MKLLRYETFAKRCISFISRNAYLHSAVRGAANRLIRNYLLRMRKVRSNEGFSACDECFMFLLSWVSPFPKKISVDSNSFKITLKG